MGFIAPFVPAIIKAGIGLGAGAVASKAFGGKNKEDQSVLNAQRDAMERGTALSRDFQNRGQSLMDLGSQTYSPAVNYWTSILQGNRDQALSAASPELKRISEQYTGLKNASAALMPRGGARAEFLGGLPFQEMRDKQNLLQSQRPTAATSLLGAGLNQSQMGAGLMRNAIDSLYASTTSGRSILDYNQQRRESDRATGAGIGKLIFDFLTNFKPEEKDK